MVMVMVVVGSYEPSLGQFPGVVTAETLTSNSTTFHILLRSMVVTGDTDQSCQSATRFGTAHSSTTIVRIRSSVYEVVRLSIHAAETSPQHAHGSLETIFIARLKHTRLNE